MQVKSIAECSKGSILQYFWPSLTYHLHWDLCFVYFWVAVLHRFYCIPTHGIPDCLFSHGIYPWKRTVFHLKRSLWAFCNCFKKCSIYICLLIKPTDQNPHVFRPPDKSVYWKTIFLFLDQNICCGYSKEPSQWNSSFEHPKCMFKLMGKERNAILGTQTILIRTFVFYMITFILNLILQHM